MEWSADDAGRLLLLRAEKVRADLDMDRARSHAAAVRELVDRLEWRREDALAVRALTAQAAVAGPPMRPPTPFNLADAEAGARALFKLPPGAVGWRPKQREVVEAASVPGAHVIVEVSTGWGKSNLPPLVAKACGGKTLVVVVAPYRAVALQMARECSDPALGEGFVFSLVSAVGGAGAAPPGEPDAGLTKEEAAVLLRTATPAPGTKGACLLAAVASGCRVVIVTAEGMSALSHTGVSIRVALSAVMAGMGRGPGPDQILVVVDEYHNAQGFRHDIANLGRVFDDMRGRGPHPVDPHRCGLLAMSAYVYPADCAMLQANIGLRSDAVHFTLPLDRGPNHVYVVRRHGMTTTVAAMAISLLEEGSVALRDPSVGIGTGPVDPVTGRRPGAPEDQRALVFVPTRALTEIVASAINRHPALTLLHGDCLVHHSGLTETDETASLEAWRRGYLVNANGDKVRVKFLAATSSLIEGLDEPNVTWVTVVLPHGDMKKTLQGWGRGGRGRTGHIRAYCTVGYSFGALTPLAQFPIGGSVADNARALDGVKDAMRFCVSMGCRRSSLLLRFGKELVGSCHGCDQCREVIPSLCAQPGPGGPLDVTGATARLFKTFVPGVTRSLGSLKKNIKGWCSGSWSREHDDWVASEVLTHTVLSGQLLLEPVANPLGSPYWHLTLAGDGGHPSDPGVAAILDGRRAVVISQRHTPLIGHE